jgi:ferredoxin
MRVWIDERACVGNGVCEELSPEVFVMVGDIAKVRDANVRPGHEDAVLAAADECPVGCIYVE